MGNTPSLTDFSPITKNVLDVNKLFEITQPKTNSNGEFIYLSSDTNVGQIIAYTKEDEKNFSINPNNLLASSMVMSLDGSTLAIGKVTGNITNNYGIVKVYRLNAGTKKWDETITPFDLYFNDKMFGYSLAISEDGNTLAIGAPTNKEFNKERGCVKVYTWNSKNNSWDLKGNQLIGDISTDEFVGEQFGKSVAISSDGNVVVVGAPTYKDQGKIRGRIVVYEWSNKSWVIKGSQILDDEFNSNETNFNVYMNYDGSIMGYSNKGSVKMFKFNNLQWEQSSSVIDGNVTALSYDGLTLCTSFSNKIFIYKLLDTTNIWNYTNNITDFSGEINNLFISKDASTIGFSLNKSNNSNGVIKIYKWIDFYNNTATHKTGWYQKGSDISGINNEELGTMFATNSDLNKFVVSNKLLNINNYINKWFIKVIGKGESKISAIQLPSTKSDGNYDYNYLTGEIETNLRVNSITAYDAIPEIPEKQKEKNENLTEAKDKYDKATKAADEAAKDVAKAEADNAPQPEIDAAKAAAAAANDAADAAYKARAEAQAAVDAVNKLSAEVAQLMAGLKSQIAALANLVVKIQKKVKA